MNWLKSSWRWAVLNISAAVIWLLVVTLGSPVMFQPGTFDTIIETGKWALRFLLICLSMTPLNTYFGWRWAVGLRKSTGLWAAAFGATHVVLGIVQNDFSFYRHGLAYIPDFVFLGLTALAILAAMAATSNRWAMRWLGKTWKRLHRLVYLAGGLIVIHALLTINSTKRMFADPQAEVELTCYVIILSLLLAVRIPPVRRLIQHMPAARLPRHEAAGR